MWFFNKTKTLEDTYLKKLIIRKVVFCREETLSVSYKGKKDDEVFKTSRVKVLTKSEFDHYISHHPPFGKAEYFQMRWMGPVFRLIQNGAILCDKGNETFYPTNQFSSFTPKIVSNFIKVTVEQTNGNTVDTYYHQSYESEPKKFYSDTYKIDLWNGWYDV